MLNITTTYTMSSVKRFVMKGCRTGWHRESLYLVRAAEIKLADIRGLLSPLAEFNEGEYIMKKRSMDYSAESLLEEVPVRTLKDLVNRNVCILTFGLLAAAQIIFVSLTSTTLSRSKGLAATAAQSQLESLADLFSRDPEATELSHGNHGPQIVEVANPGEGTVLNRFSVGWTVGGVTDPRPGRVLHAKQVTVTVTPIDVGGTPQPKGRFNKVVSISVILSTRLP